MATTGTLEGIDYDARTRLTEQVAYSSPQRECDVVMKGGITSGVLYPLAVCELASTYRLRNVGGTSAGAIAAAAAAAAEYGRHSNEPGSGYVGLADLPEWSRQPGNLVGVFQPAKSTRGLHALLLAAIEKPTGTIGKVAKYLRILFHLVAAALGRYVWAPLLAMAPGVGLLWVLDWAPHWHWLLGGGIVVSAAAMLAALVALATAPEPPEHLRCVPQHERDRQKQQWDDARNRRLARTLFLFAVVIAGAAALVLALNAADEVRVALGAALAVLAIGLGLLVGCIVAVVLGSGRGLSGNMYGIVAGSSETNDALSDWLADLIDELAGHKGEDPLTFQNLWSGPAAGKAPEADPFVNLEMLTTCVTQARPYRLPHALGEEFFFDPNQFERIFPRRVVKYLCDFKEPTGRTASDQKKRDSVIALAAKQGLKPLPPPQHLPVVVATRMSLSFPILISAVPLYAIDYTCKGIDGTFRFEPCWFSDGGITSNFPITFFDSLLPRRPTFGINLRKFHPAYPQSEKQECDNIWMPHDNRGGITEWWSRPSRSQGIGGVVGFLLGIVDTMQNWIDNQQTRVPGFRDRIVHIYHNGDEGGMNLDMPPDTLERLSERGRCAGDRLVEYYTTEAEGRTVSWENHRWIRMRTTLALLEEATQSITAAYADHYRDDLHRPTADLPSFAWANQRQRALAITLMDGAPDEQPEPPIEGPRGFVEVGAMLNRETAAKPNVTMRNKAPTPLPRLELRPGE